MCAKSLATVRRSPSGSSPQPDHDSGHCFAAERSGRPEDLSERALQSDQPLLPALPTVPEFTAKFVPSQADYDAVVLFAQMNGLTVVGGSRDGMDVQVEGPVPAIQSAFHVSMGPISTPPKDAPSTRRTLSRQPSPLQPLAHLRFGQLLHPAHHAGEEE